MWKNLSIKKIIIALLVINTLQFLAGLAIWLSIERTVFEEINVYIYLSMGLMIFSTLVTIRGLFYAYRYKHKYLEDSISNLEELNTKLHTQRHDYLNHFQVIYGLIELGEFEEAKQYIEPVFKDILKVSKALKTAQPAVNALLQAKIEAAEKNQIDLFLEVRSDLKCIPMEPWNLCIVMANIIDNSITALSEDKRMRENTEKTIHIIIGENMVEYTFEIYNNGPMIVEHELEEIFKQGFTSKNEHGHGMGLYIVSKILREVNGNIKVTSNRDKTSFIIHIPKKQSNPDS